MIVTLSISRVPLGRLPPVLHLQVVDRVSEEHEGEQTAYREEDVVQGVAYTGKAVHRNEDDVIRLEIDLLVGPAVDDDIVHTKFKPFHIIRSEEVGTFYRSYHEIETKGDEQEPLVFIGQIIEEGDIIGIINAMRLDIEIKSEFSGMIVEILVEDNTPVEFGQLLMFINPK